jgi:transcription-repair coupling factor (superfamily II helicase)
MELGRDRTVQEILTRLESAAGSEEVVKVEGTWGSFGSMLVAYISESTGRPILYVRPHIDDADKAGDDLHTFGGRAIEAFGAWEGEEDLADATDEIRAQRLMLVSHISSLVSRVEDVPPPGARPSNRGQSLPRACRGDARDTLKCLGNIRDTTSGQFIVPASIQSLCQPIPKPEAIEAGSLQLEVERQVSPETVVEWLVENGFERTERVDLPGQFARRGGIVDVYAPLVNEIVWNNHPHPDKRHRDEAATRVEMSESIGWQPPPEGVPEGKQKLGDGGALSSIGAEALRIEFFGDTIESIREIDLDTLRSSRQMRSIRIVSVVCGTGTQQHCVAGIPSTRSGQALPAIRGPGPRGRDALDTELFINILPKDTIIVFEEPGEIEEVAKVFLDRAEDPARLYNWGDIYKAAGNFTQLHICRFATAQPDDFLKVDIKSVQQFQHKATSVWAGHKAALEELLAEAKKGREVLLYCESSAEIKRVGEIAADIDKKIPARFKLLPGFIHQGFVIDSLDTIIISHHELFGQYALRRRRRPTRISSPVDTLSDLQDGDYVVHASYGIGRFSGIQTIQEKGGTNEYLTIEYADGVKIQVSVRNIALVQK